MAFFHDCLTAIVEMFGKGEDVGVIWGIVVTVKQASSGALLPMISVSGVIGAQPDIYNRAIPYVKPQLQGSPSAAAHDLGSNDYIAELIQRDLFQLRVHQVTWAWSWVSRSMYASRFSHSMDSSQAGWL